MFALLSFIKSICYNIVISDDDVTIEDYSRMVLKNFNDTNSIEVDKNIKLLKKKIVAFLDDNYSGFDIKLSPIHKTDNWGDKKYVYIAVGIFNPVKNNTEKQFILDRLILKIEGNNITIKNKEELDRYVNVKNILS
jgi:vacuolar-type H+-ATPase subunit B/Vma2